jgi:hypothetical protein
MIGPARKIGATCLQAGLCSFWGLPQIANLSRTFSGVRSTRRIQGCGIRVNVRRTWCCEADPKTCTRGGQAEEKKGAGQAGRAQRALLSTFSSLLLYCGEAAMPPVGLEPTT